MLSPPFENVRSLTFDLMGTCLDWHTSVLSSLRNLAPRTTKLDLSQLADDWRAGFFKHILTSFERGEESPDIDSVQKQVLDRLLEESGEAWDEEVRRQLVRSWHTQVAWKDVIRGIERLKRKFNVVVLANGTTRLQLDIISSSGVPFHALFSSQLIGYTKPDPRVYERCLELLDRKADEVCMIAAHAYDLRAAAKVGMRTIYIQRDTEDLTEDMDQVRAEVDYFIDGRTLAIESGNGGLLAVAELLGV